MMPIFYLPISYPDRETFFQLLDLLQKYQVPMVEIGLPATNPFLDGELIQRINHQLLQAGLSTAELTKILLQIRGKYTFQVVLMTYKEGVERFSLQELPMDLYAGILCVDAALSQITFPKQVALVSPASKAVDVKTQCVLSHTFIYLMSHSGKTGEKVSLENAPYQEILPLLKHYSKDPVYVGFGVKNAQDVSCIRDSGADGAIVGTEFLHQYELGGLSQIEQYLQSFQ